jgi:hypothetical protein
MGCLSLQVEESRDQLFAKLERVLRMHSTFSAEAISAPAFSYFPTLYTPKHRFPRTAQ